MDEGEIRDRISGPEPTLFIDAPAGHGKTYEAVRAAVALTVPLSAFERILVLTHTNAAREAFKAELGGALQGVVFQTLDSFAVALVETYGRYLDCPVPLHPEQDGHPSFGEVRVKALDLLGRSPAVAEAIALRHPVILVDEHQDSTVIQDELVRCLANSGAMRARYFGDEMQAIFDFDDNEPVDWSGLCAKGEVLRLSHGYRWDHDPELREFLANARAALSQGQCVDLRKVPRSVHVSRYSGRAPAPRQRSVPSHCADALWAMRNSVGLAVLVHPNLHALSIRKRVGHLVLHEGMQPDDPKKLLESALAASGDAMQLSRALVNTLQHCGSGLDNTRRDQLIRVCQPEGIKLGRMKRIAPITEIIAPLYRRPDVATWLDCLRTGCERASTIGWKRQREDSLSLLTGIHIEKDDDAMQAFYELAGVRRHALHLGPRIVTTIHKAKGREFSEVALPFVSETEFPASPDGRKRLYVALTRASRQLRLMIPEENPSPLIRL